MWLNYASDEPYGQIFLISVVLVLTSRYFIVGVEQGTHMFADVQDFAFSLHNLNETTVPAIRAVRDHIVSNYMQQETIFKVHIVTTGAAWVLMPFQIWKSFRRADIGRHRTVGWTTLSLLAVGMVTSFFIARPMRECEEGGGFTSEVGFYGMAIATSFCAMMGVYKVQQKQIDEHRRWMVRAYGCMWGSFFWFRIAMVSLLPLLPKDYHHGLGLISNLSWVSGWLGADVALSLSASSGGSGAAAAIDKQKKKK